MLNYKFLFHCVLSCLRLLNVYLFPFPFLRNHFLMSFYWTLEIFPMNTGCCKASSADYYPFLLFQLIFPFNLLVANLLTFYGDCRNVRKHKLLWYLLKFWNNVKPLLVYTLVISRQIKETSFCETWTLWFDTILYYIAYFVFLVV